MENLNETNFYEEIDSFMQESINNVIIAYNTLIKLLQTRDELLKTNDSKIQDLTDQVYKREKEIIEYKKEIDTFKKNELKYDSTIDNLKEKIKELNEINSELNRSLSKKESEENYSNFCRDYAYWEKGCPKPVGLDIRYDSENKSLDQVLEEWDKLDKIPNYARTEKSNANTYTPKIKLDQIEDIKPLYKGFAELLNKTFGQEYFTFDELEDVVNDYYDHIYNKPIEIQNS